MGLPHGKHPLVKIGLGIGAPLLVAVVWGVFEAPASAQRLQGLAALALKIVLFGSAVLALAKAGQPTLAGAFALLVALNHALIYLWKQ